MPVKSKRFPSNGIYEGKITGLDESEKEALENAGVGGNVDGKDISPKNVSVSGKLTINSSSDIVTKDGSKVGGSSLPITNVTYDEEGNPQIPEEGGYSINYFSDLDSGNSDDKAKALTFSAINEDPNSDDVLGWSIVVDPTYGIIFERNKHSDYRTFAFTEQRFDELFSFDDNDLIITYGFVNGTKKPIFYAEYNYEIVLRINYPSDNSYITLPSGEGTLAFTKDIPTYYNHFITLKSSDNKYILFFNAYTKDNAPIASLNDLYSKLPNTYFMCNGKADTLIPYAIHIGTSASNTTITGDGTISISSFTSVIDNVTTI